MTLSRTIAIYSVCLLLTSGLAQAAELGAYYTRLVIENDDPVNRVGSHPDIVVRLGENIQFVFCRDSSFLPCVVVV